MERERERERQQERERQNERKRRNGWCGVVIEPAESVKPSEYSRCINSTHTHTHTHALTVCCSLFLSLSLFTFSHLADAFIQSDLHMCDLQCIHILHLHTDGTLHIRSN